MKEFKIDNKIRLIELFAGVGSQAMALRDIGADFEHYKVVEYDRFAIASYNAIHGTNFETMDITKIHGSDLEIVGTDQYTYIMTYSFPCQDLSIAGRLKGMKKGTGTRSGLLWEVERLLNETNELPNVLLMENVSQVIGKNNIDDFNQWCNFLESKGYTNHYKVMNAKNYGIPQNRERCFMVSILGDYDYTFPVEVDLEVSAMDQLQKNVDDSYYIKATDVLNLVDKMYTIDSSEVIIVKQATKKGYIECIPGGLAELSYPKSNSRRGRVQGGGKISPTLTASMSGLCCIETHDRIRKVTTNECWRLMDFTDEDFKKAEQVNSNSQLYKQAGNSIVKRCLMAIFLQMNIQGIATWNDIEG